MAKHTTDNRIRSTSGASESAHEAIELAIARQTMAAFASWGVPRVATPSEAARRADELAALADAARAAVRR